MLSEMHDKLSHAVRLYDQLLTDQIVHPTWRAAYTSQQPSFHESYAAPPSALSRHSALSRSMYAPSAIPSSTTLGRSDTTASHSQPHQVYAPPPNTSNLLPTFPTAPISDPLYPLYSPPTTGFEETKKEVTLIDL